jgi:two-component system NtrC family response regulator
MIRVLVVDGDKKNCAIFAEAELHLGYELSVRHTLSDCLEAVRTNPPDIIFIDSDLSDGNSIGHLDKLQRCPSVPTIIVMATRGTPEDAERAIRNGAWDYIQKPAGLRETTSRLSRAIQYRGELKNRNKKMRSSVMALSATVRRCAPRWISSSRLRNPTSTF